MGRRMWRATGAVVAMLVFAIVGLVGISAQSVGNSSVFEGDSGSFQHQILINGSFEPGDRVSYSSRDGSATVADGDYGAVNADAVCPSGGDRCSSVFAYVTIFGDTDIESDEQFYIDVSGVGTATITIRNDDEETPPDTTPPTLNLPGNLTEEATGPGGAAVSFSVSASDNDSPPATASCDATSGATFPLGTTTVNCSASDAVGNTATGSFNVIVQDTSPPAVTVPGDLTAEATGPSGVSVTFSASATDAVSGDLPTTCTPATGDTFPLGATQVTCSATDAAANIGSASFNVTVQDTTVPEVTVPGNIHAEATGPEGAVVTFDATASDTVSGWLATGCSPATGVTFPLGTTPVTCSATDAAGNTGSATFEVTVRDTIAPEVTVPDTIIAEATGPSGAVVTYMTSVADAVNPNLVASCAPSSGETFPSGSTSVTCTATDAAGNTGSASFNVTVRDTTPPTLNLPENIFVDATGPEGAVVTYIAGGTDIVDGKVPASCAPVSGTVFPLGTTTVTCTVSDNAGNTSDAESFAVAVEDMRATRICEAAIAGAGSGSGPFGNHELVEGSTWGGSGDQVIVGTNGAETLVGGRGNDVLCGLGGNDVLIGGSGDDILVGGEGNDTLLSGSGADTIYATDGETIVGGSGGNDTLLEWLP